MRKGVSFPKNSKLYESHAHAHTERARERDREINIRKESENYYRESEEMEKTKIHRGLRHTITELKC